MGDFIVGGKWHLLGGWVANPKGSDPEIYKKSVLKTKKLFQNLFQRWCLISTFNCPCLCNSFFAPSSRGRLAQLLEGAVAAQCFGRGFPSPGGMCWVLVPELTGFPRCDTVAKCDHLLQTEVTCTPQRVGWHLGCGTCTVHPIARPATPPHCEQGWHWPGAACVAPGSLNLPLGTLLMVMTQLEAWPAPSHLGWWWHPRGSLWGQGTVALWWQPQGFTLMGAILCTPKYQRGWQNLGGSRAESRSGSCAACGCMYSVTFREQIQVGQFTL